VYVEKKKNNSFDGFLGFSNSEEKLILNGYVDLNLSNVLNSGDLFSLKWRSDGQDQTNFNLGVELPFLFKSPLGLKVQLNIFKQDSTFQNSKTDLDLGYYLTNKSKLFVGYQSVESSDIQNSNTALLNDFTNNFITTSFEHVNLTDDFLFPEKTFFFLKLGMGKRDSKFNSNSQFLAQLNVSHILEFNSKNSLFLSSQNYYLQSETFLTNELFRFGGIKSIRGFRENSLQGNQ
jgi:hemolysin activation/secretion protein